jgi:hypothetical protein
MVVVHSANAQSRSTKTFFCHSQGSSFLAASFSAMKDGHLDTAACRYDKAVQYCSVAFIINAREKIRFILSRIVCVLVPLKVVVVGKGPFQWLSFGHH